MLKTFPVFLFVLAAWLSCRVPDKEPTRPHLSEFIGINFHTVLVHDADLYAQTSRLARDYHPVSWDVWNSYNGATYFPDSPMSRNGVKWDSLYRCWQNAGYSIHASLCETDKYLVNLPNNCFSENALSELKRYGKRFALSFGPGGKWPLVASVEIENEPSRLKENQYANLLDSVATGLRAGNSKLKIATCAMTADYPANNQFDQSLHQLSGKENLFDIITMHTYALKSGWPAFERSYPEDPAIDYLAKIDRMIAYRNQHPALSKKPVWITEFGFDAGTDEARKRYPQWVSSTEKEQAIWIVRSFLLFSEKDIERAYLYWFEDDDTGNFHGASGIVRKNKSTNTHDPKPSFYAMRHLLNALGNYRFKKVVTRQKSGLYIYEFENDDKHLAWAVWSASNGKRSYMRNLIHLPSKNLRIEKLRLDEGELSPRLAVAGNDSIAIMISETPKFLFFD